MLSRQLCLFAVCAFCASTVVSLGQKAPVAATPFQVIGYFTEDGAKWGRYTVKDIVNSGAAARLTQINYAFGRVANNQCRVADREAELDHRYTAANSVDGQDDLPGPNQLRGTFRQLQELKRQFPKLKIIISFGGWNQSGGH